MKAGAHAAPTEMLRVSAHDAVALHWDRCLHRPGVDLLATQLGFNWNAGNHLSTPRRTAPILGVHFAIALRRDRVTHGYYGMCTPHGQHAGGHRLRLLRETWHRSRRREAIAAHAEKVSLPSHADAPRNLLPAGLPRCPQNTRSNPAPSRQKLSLAWQASATSLRAERASQRIKPVPVPRVATVVTINPWETNI